MESNLIWANLVSNNLDKTRKFYTELGFESNEKYSSEESTSFLFGQNKFVINFFTKQRLEKKENGNLNNAENQNEVIFSLSANSKEDVNKWAEKVKSAGGTIFSNPQDYEKGYNFVFSDPDGHKFNVLYWPGM
ncbi:VOC family protein [Flavobacterium sp. W1B]|uniref:VOC family protein n=1 Tax=Flavobacterium sp. W1B TaxID=3394146 RepID=UPI0039BC71F6